MEYWNTANSLPSDLYSDLSKIHIRYVILQLKSFYASHYQRLDLKFLSLAFISQFVQAVITKYFQLGKL